MSVHWTCTSSPHLVLYYALQHDESVIMLLLLLRERDLNLWGCLIESRNKGWLPGWYLQYVACLMFSSLFSSLFSSYNDLWSVWAPNCLTLTG